MSAVNYYNSSFVWNKIQEKNLELVKEYDPEFQKFCWETRFVCIKLWLTFWAMR
jgi:hypothetical protein